MLRVEAAAGEVSARHRRHRDRGGLLDCRHGGRKRHRREHSRPGRARRARAWTASPGEATSAVVAPLGFRGRARGVLVALDRMREGPAFDTEDEHLLGSFAASAAIAIATAQSVEAERLRHSMRASEEERARWARELHDETLQELGALKVMLDPPARRRTPGG